MGIMGTSEGVTTVTFVMNVMNHYKKSVMT